MSVTATLRLGRDAEGIVRLNALLAELFAAAGTDPAVADDLKLCLNEAVANVMSYAEPPEGPLQIDIDLAVGPDSAHAVVADNGQPFDPLAHPGARPITGLADAQVGGFGIALLRQTARELRWETPDGHGNRLTLVCGGPAPA